MKTCLICHTSAQDEMPTCAACGEASWSAVVKKQEKPAPKTAKSPKKKQQEEKPPSNEDDTLAVLRGESDEVLKWASEDLDLPEAVRKMAMEELAKRSEASVVSGS